MNECLKAIAQEGYDLYKTGAAVAGKSPFASLIPLLVKDGMDAPAVINNVASLKAEALALIADPASDADLLAFCAGLVGGDSAHAQKIVAAVGKCVIDAVSDFEAVKSAFAPEVAPAPAAS